MTDLRNSQALLEAWLEAEADLDVSQSTIEVWLNDQNPTVDLRASQATIEVWLTDGPAQPAPGVAAPRGAWYCRPSEDAANLATLSADNAAVGSDVATLQGNVPGDRFVAAGTSLVVTLTLPASVAPVAAFVFNSNATSAAIAADNGAFDIAIEMPPRTIDGHVRNGMAFLGGVLTTPDPENPLTYVVIEGSPSNADTVFRFTLSKGGSAPLECGRLVLALKLRELPFTAGEGPPAIRIGADRFGAARNRTRAGYAHRRVSPWTPVLTVSGTIEPVEYVRDVAHLERETQSGGPDGQGFAIMVSTVLDDPIFATFAGDGVRYEGGAVAGRCQVEIEEIARGSSPPAG